MSVVIKITPRGVRSGDPDVLAGLCAQRGAAVLAYCEHVAPPGQAGAAAVDAFFRFRGEVAATPEHEAFDADERLLAAARRAAAARRNRTVASRNSEPSANGCAGLHGVLVAWVEERLPPADHRRIRQHLAGCPICADGLKRFEAGERAYGRPPRAPVPERIANRIVDALVAAAPVTALGGDAVAVRDHAERRMIMLRALAWPPPSRNGVDRGRVARAPVVEPPDHERPADAVLVALRRSLDRVRRVHLGFPRLPALRGGLALLLGLVGGIALFVLLDSLSPALPPSAAAGRGSPSGVLSSSPASSLTASSPRWIPPSGPVRIPSRGLLQHAPPAPAPVSSD